MTNLKPVTEGFNRFCGPAVLSILTGKSTDECASVITKINGKYNVTGVELSDLIKAAERLGFITKHVTPSGSLYRTLTSIIKNDGMYIVTVPNHFVCVEVNDKKIYFCDNHTKEPIPAASSARLGQQVLALVKVTKNPNFVEHKKPEPVIIEPVVRVASPEFVEVMNLCNAVKHLKCCHNACDISVGLLRDSARRIYLRIIDIKEMEAAIKLINETEWY